MGWHLVESNPGYLQFNIQLAPTKNVARALSGRTYAVYAFLDDYTNPGAPTTQSIRLAWSDDLAIWNYTWIPFTQAFHFLTQPSIAVDSNGIVYVVYREYQELWVERFMLAVFDEDCNPLAQEPFDIDKPRVQGFETNPSICTDANNNVHIAYHCYTGHLVTDVSKLFYVKRTEAGAWGAIEELESENGPWSYMHPVMCISVDGTTPHLIYFYEKWLAFGQYYDYRYIHAWKNGGWNKEVVHEHLPEERTERGWNFSTASPDGKIHISYKTGVFGSPAFYHREKNGGVWSAPFEITDSIDSSPWLGYVFAYTNKLSSVFATGYAVPATDNYIPWMHKTTKQPYWTAGAGIDNCLALTGDADFVYVSLQTTPGKVVKIDKSTMATSLIWDALAGENFGYGLVQDANYVYVGFSVSPARVVRIQKSDMTRVDFWEGGAGENKCQVLTQDDDYIYAGLNTDPAKVIKISKATMATVDAWEGGPVEEYSCYSLAQDANFVYASLWVDLAKVVKIDKSTMTTSLIWTGDAGEESSYPVVQDNDFIYVGLYMDPTIVIKVAKSTMTKVSSWASLVSPECVCLAIDDEYIYVGCEASTTPIIKIIKSTIDQWYGVSGEHACYGIVQDADYVFGSLSWPAKVRRIVKSTLENNTTKIGLPSGTRNDGVSVSNSLFPVSGTNQPLMPENNHYNSHLFLMISFDEEIWLWAALLPAQELLIINKAYALSREEL